MVLMIFNDFSMFNDFDDLRWFVNEQFQIIPSHLKSFPNSFKALSKYKYSIQI